MISPKLFTLTLAFVLTLLVAASAERINSSLHVQHASTTTSSNYDHATDEFADLEEQNPMIFSLKGTRNLQTQERVSIWTQLKESLGLFVVGLLLICVMPCVIWKNEGRHVRELKRIDFCKNEAVSVECESPSEDTVGRLVHFVGTVEVGDDSPLELKAGALNVSTPVPKALAIKRTCYIYQKMEYQSDTKKDVVGGGETRMYDFKEDWMTSPGPAQLEKTGETNSRGIWDMLVNVSGEQPPEGPPAEEGDDKAAAPNALLASLLAQGPPHGVAASTNARVGGFGLSKDVIGLVSDDLVPVPNEYIPAFVSECESLMKGSDNTLRTFQEGSPPRNGDCKVVYEYAMDGFECTFVVQQTTARKDEGDGSVPFGVDQHQVVDDSLFGKCSGDLGTVWLVRKGNHDLEEMIELAKADENRCHKILRVVCFALLMGGWVMLFSPLTTTLSTLPILSQLGYFAVVLTALIVSCTCCITVTAAAYVAYRPVLMLGILALSLGIWGIIAWQLGEANDNVAEEGTS